MDLLKYLEPMKNAPERFSNLAFWRGVRKLKDEVVNAFEYVDSWGDSIETKENDLENLINSKSGFELLTTINLSIDMFSNLRPVENTYFLNMTNPPIVPNIPENCKFVIIYSYFNIHIGSKRYVCQALWPSPIANGTIIFPASLIPCDRIITVDAEPSITLAQGSCWCYG